MDLLDTAVYDLIGETGFARLVAAFYAQVPADDILGSMYPADDITGAQLRLRDFLIQRFGGPDRYAQSRGHPRLRMRHAPFHIDPAARDRWLQLMDNALRQTALPEPADLALRTFFRDAANHMINR